LPQMPDCADEFAVPHVEEPQAGKCGEISPPEGVKNCDYNKNLNMKNILTDLSLKTMFVAHNK
jgi:hypothetical protein